MRGSGWSSLRTTTASDPVTRLWVVGMLGEAGLERRKRDRPEEVGTLAVEYAPSLRCYDHPGPPLRPRLLHALLTRERPPYTFAQGRN